jgi:hypothetical protein
MAPSRSPRDATAAASPLIAVLRADASARLPWMKWLAGLGTVVTTSSWPTLRLLAPHVACVVVAWPSRGGDAYREEVRWLRRRRPALPVVVVGPRSRPLSSPRPCAWLPASCSEEMLAHAMEALRSSVVPDGLAGSECERGA